MAARLDDRGHGTSVVIDGRYLVMPDAPRGEFAGLPAYMAEHRPGEEAGSRGGNRLSAPLIAVRARRDAPPRANLAAYLNAYNTALLMPLAHGPGAGEYWIVCDAPQGSSISDQLKEGQGGATEAELAATYLRPLALALGRLHSLGLVHRGVRPTNLYRSDEAGRILLAPGCVMPPAYGQPVLYEPPASGICPPANRGNGNAADDVYALGVVLLELALGRAPMAGLDDEQILRRKLELGSFQALTMGERLPPVLTSLFRAMLSDEPSARPELAALGEHGVGAERPKMPRPDARAPRPLMLGKSPVSSARMLAFGFARQPTEAMALLGSGAIDQWLRRALEQSLLAARVEEVVRQGRERGVEGADPLLVMQMIALLDPLAPVFWAGAWFWPDAAPAMLAAQLINGTGGEPIAETLRQGALRRWAQLTGRNAQLVVDDLERRSARVARLPVPALRAPMLAYSLNPFLACTSPQLGGAYVLQASQLLLALEQMVANAPASTARLLDSQMLALLAARSEGSAAENAAAIPADADERLLDLHALARTQAEARLQGPGQGQPQAGAFASLPRLAARLLPAARERLLGWPGKGRRARRQELLDQAVAAGDLVAMLDLCIQEDAWKADDVALAEARQQAVALRASSQLSRELAPARARAAREAGREVAVVAGIIALAAASVVAVAS